MKPIIGITGNSQPENNSIIYKDFYVAAINRAGGIAILLPPTCDEGLIEDYLNICRGLLFSGGGDFDPACWGEVASPQSGAIDPLRDRFELSLAKKAFGSGKAVLGICRGCQLLNIAAGGSLWQDIQSPLSHVQKAPRNYPIHDIFIENDSQLRSIMQDDHVSVNSFHHQAVKEVGPGLAISALAGDGTVEAIESRQHPFYVGVQWHPECMRDVFSARLFKALITSAQR
ncbi:MAG: gamma-glutamyl-gamma-aminobutyrate hydrolase family protein [Syntrophomonas sp.]|nr:gamma-glutamyl-gamma-aminobutyrate hydrolase family protein [Syntrophomonas sp.]